jgi:diamine N-acetyltransferase
MTEAILSTPRLTLRPHRESDTPRLIELLDDPPLARNWATRDPARARAESTANTRLFTVEHAGAPIGAIACQRFATAEQAHTGIDALLGAPAWECGLGAEAMLALVEHLFATCGARRLTADPDAQDRRAIAVYEKVGFRHVGVLRQYRSSVDQSAADRSANDAVLLELLAGDFAALRAPRAPNATAPVRIEAAQPADEALLLSFMADFNLGEAIEIDGAKLRAALAELLSDMRLGRVWLIKAAQRGVGYAVLTFGYDLEFGGRDAFLTELYLAADARGQGIGAQALALIELAAESLGVHAIHLMVRPENLSAVRLYQAHGYRPPPRLLLTHRLHRG